MHEPMAPDPVQGQVNMTGDNLGCMSGNHIAIICFHDSVHSLDRMVNASMPSMGAQHHEVTSSIL